MGEDRKPEVLGPSIGLGHAVDLALEVEAGLRDGPEPFDDVRRGADATEVDVAVPVAEPTPHLKKRVVHRAGAKEETDTETGEGQSARELVAANEDDGS